jgi:hypothetical protein
MRKQSLNGGYVWLFLLLIGIVLIMIFALQGGLFPGSKVDGNIFDKATGAIDGAKEVKQKLEDGYRFDPEEQEKSIDDMN